MISLVNSFTTVAWLESYLTLYDVKYIIYLYRESDDYSIPGTILCQKIKSVKQQ